MNLSQTGRYVYEVAMFVSLPITSILSAISQFIFNAGYPGLIMLPDERPFADQSSAPGSDLELHKYYFRLHPIRRILLLIGFLLSILLRQPDRS